MGKKTIVLGASDNPARYSYMAMQKLQAYGHEVIPVSNKKTEVMGIPVQDISEIHKDVDTITLYVGPRNQDFYEDYILKTKPSRVIFNPGTESVHLQSLLDKNGIEYEEACTLVMLSVGEY